MSRSRVSTAREDVRRGALRELRLGAAIAPPAEAVEHERERQQAALRLLQPAEAARAAALPTLATAGDVREAVRYLKKKPAGVSLTEASDDVKRRLFEPRKVAAYEIWGIVERRGERIYLSPTGWELAGRLAPGAEGYRALINRTELYHSALEWIGRECGDLVTHHEVAHFWRQLRGDRAPHDVPHDEGHVVCFFHICQAAALGTLTVGKRGQPSRLRVERDELTVYLEEARRRAASLASGDAETDRAPARAGSASTHAGTGRAARPADGRWRVFISVGGGGARLAEQVQTVLGVADNECHVVARGASDALLVSAETAQAMRRCDAAVIIVTREDCRRGDEASTAAAAELRQGLAAEICAADVIYERRVAVLWEKGVPVPAALDELLRFEFESDGLTWEIGIGLLKTVKEFQRRERDAA